MLRGALAMGKINTNPAITEEFYMPMGGDWTIPTTGTAVVLGNCLIPNLYPGVRWKLTGAGLFSSTGLSANNTNYVQFGLVNVGNSSAAMFGNDNTSVSLGLGGITANTKRTILLTSTPANLLVDRDDVLVFSVTITGTLGSTLTGTGLLLSFEQYTIN